MAAPASAPSRVRPRSRRGEGARLREEIVAAASEIIAETGDDRELTLRGVARRIGIAAPSIYRHFTDVDDLKLAVVDRSFALYAQAREEAQGGAVGPAEALLARCRAYCRYALDHPGPYRYMWSHRAPRPGTDLPAFESLAALVRRCQEAGVARPADDARLLAAEVWAALHGLLLLRMNAPELPWPAPLERMADHAVARLVGVDPPAAEPCGP
jgi:AcrR family transcriptional regulator